MASIFPDEGLDYLLGLLPLDTNTSPASLYIGLFTSQTASTVPARTMVLATPTGITEATGTAYARQTLSAGSWGSIATNGNGRKSTYAQVTFPTVGAGGWGTINGFFIATASTAGICIYAANFDDTTAIVSAENGIIKVTPAIQYDGV